MNKYQVFEISKDGKRIIESGLSLEKAESVSQEIAKLNLENVYGYEPDCEMKMDNLKIFKDKLEEIEIGITTQTYISSDDGDYLISLAKELIRTVEEQHKEIEGLKQYKKTLMENSVVRSKKIEEQQEEIEAMKRYISNGIEFGYIDDREKAYKKFTNSK